MKEVVDSINYYNKRITEVDNDKSASMVFDDLAVHIRNVRSDIEELKEKLEKSKELESDLLFLTRTLMSKINKPYPLAVTRNDYIIVITEKNITIEKMSYRKIFKNLLFSIIIISSIILIIYVLIVPLIELITIYGILGLLFYILIYGVAFVILFIIVSLIIIILLLKS